MGDLQCSLSSAPWRPRSSCKTSRRSPATLAIPCRGSMTTRTRCALGSSTTAVLPCSPQSARSPPVCTRARTPSSSSGSEPSHSLSTDGAIILSFYMVEALGQFIHPLGTAQCLGADFRGPSLRGPSLKTGLTSLPTVFSGQLTWTVSSLVLDGQA